MSESTPYSSYTCPNGQIKPCLRTSLSFPKERSREQTPRWAPFVPGLPRSVLVLAYQRTGSTYFGELFNRDRRAFYLYEPLDGIYSSIYGTLPGWSTPSDISSYANGTLRYAQCNITSSQQQALFKAIHRQISAVRH